MFQIHPDPSQIQHCANIFKGLRTHRHSRPILKIFNSLGRVKQEFVPLRAGEVRMYVCGMTVYDYMHLGHARMLVVFDVVARYLRILGYKLTYVRNITDIDDKIIKRANENGEPIQALTERFIRANEEDFAALGLLEPEHEPRATHSIPGMVRMISELIARGHAYAAANGDVYYDVSSFPGYGKLSGKDPGELRAGARVEIDEAKDDPLDFVLWRQPSRASRHGIPPGARDVRAGTSNAPSCRASFSARSSIFTAAARISSSRTTRTRSPSRKAQMP
jgi:cysteinyl-tRNA synthetase